jgi:hypothetical protein
VLHWESVEKGRRAARRPRGSIERSSEPMVSAVLDAPIGRDRLLFAFGASGTNRWADR